MLPRKEFVKIDTNEELIIDFLEEVMILPRLKILEWSKITNQTPNLRVGYPGQHLASLITGVKGEGTGARGNDIIDGSEVKSCSRIDQLDKCKDCKDNVLRFMPKCPHCGSTNIDRKEDSKWLFTIRTKEELDLLTIKLDRVVLVFFHYPKFSEGNYDEVLIEVFEIWPKDKRNIKFKELLDYYYYNEFLPKTEKAPTKTPNPKNFWPKSYQFYLCNPIKIASIDIKDFNTNPKLSFDTFVKPLEDRSLLKSVEMPSYVLKIEEYNIILSNASEDEIKECLYNEDDYSLLSDLVARRKKSDLIEKFKYINETLRNYLPFRDIVNYEMDNLYERNVK